MFAKVRNAVKSTQEEIAGFFELRGEGEHQTSGFSEVIAGVTDIAAQKIGVTTQMALKGSMGGATRALNKELEAEAIAENPGLAMAELLPKSLKKNPLALMGLNSIFQKYLAGGLGGGAGTGGGGASDNGQAKFNL